MGKKKIAVIFGGQSSEHEVSRVSAQSVINNIDRSKFDIAMVGITKDGRWLAYDGPVALLGTGEWQAVAEAKARAGLKNVNHKVIGDHIGESNSIQNRAYESTEGKDLVISENCARGVLAGVETDGKPVDVVFPVLHGCNGEDGTVQGLFELAGVPYVGCGVLGSALGMDKGYSKIVFEKEGIPQGKYLVFSRKQISREIDSLIDEVEKLLIYPCFVKPSNAGSSVGVGKAHDRAELVAALNHAARYDRRVLVEEFIDGREVECAVLGNDMPIASIAGEIVPCNEFYDYEAKYSSGDNSKIIIPAQISDSTMQKVREYAVKAFKALDCAGLARADFFVHKDTGEVFINELNTLPGFTSISMYPKLWEATGLSYSQLIEKLIDLAEERYEDNRKEIDGI